MSDTSMSKENPSTTGSNVTTSALGSMSKISFLKFSLLSRFASTPLTRYLILHDVEELIYFEPEAAFVDSRITKNKSHQ